MADIIFVGVLGVIIWMLACYRAYEYGYNRGIQNTLQFIKHLEDSGEKWKILEDGEVTYE